MKSFRATDSLPDPLSRPPVFGSSALTGISASMVTVQHLDCRCSWRTIIKLQARLLSRWLRGDVPHHRNVVPR